MKSINPHIISARWILPIDEESPLSSQLRLLEDHAIAIEDRRIIDIGPKTELLVTYPKAAHTELHEHILMPGLVNAHNLTAMTLFKGLTDPQPLAQWLKHSIWPLEHQWLSAAFARDSVALGIIEMLLSGTTCFSDSYLYPDASASVAETLGMRAQIHFPISEHASHWAQNSGEYFSKGLEISDEYRHSALITTGFGPHSAVNVSDKSFDRIAILAEEIDRPIHIYLHSNDEEITDSVKQYGLQPIERLMQLGVLSSRTQAIQVGHLNTQDELQLINSGASVIQCPAASMNLSVNLCSSSSLLQKGVKVGLGTDSAACGNNLDLFASLKLAVILSAQGDQSQPTLNCSAGLRMATLGGAEALGLDDDIGSLTVGKQADIIAIDTQSPCFQPLNSVTRQLVYGGAGSAVSHVWVAGHCKVSDGKLIGIDQSSILDKSRWWQHKITS